MTNDGFVGTLFIPSFVIPHSDFVIPPMYDTIIIGAGMSGLAAGIRLAYYDQKVCILERHTTIGGLNSFYLLVDQPEVYGLPPDPKMPSRNLRSGSVFTVLGAILVGLAGVFSFRERGGVDGEARP